MPIPTRAELDTMLHDRLATDPDFRTTLLNDPHAAISGLLGISLPDTVIITVHEESLTDIHLVLPAPTQHGSELAEDDLELVAGGSCWIDGPCSDGLTPRHCNTF